MSSKRIYLDYAATTPLDPRVLKVMDPFFTKKFGNPSSIHAEGVAAKKALDEARVKVTRCLEAHPDEIVFTSGGTEANNLAIFGVVEACRSLTPTKSVGVKLLQTAKPHLVTTNIEHASVMEPLRELERQGRIEVTYVPVEPNGIVNPEKVIAAIRPNTVLLSVMYANNEIGTIQPIRKIGEGIRKFREVKSQKSTVNGPNEKVYPLFHSDACQAPLYLNCLVNTLGVDLMTLDGHKMYGPKGEGALYVRRGTPLAPALFGGGQEKGLRSTTENVPAIVGFAEALRIATAERETESVHEAKLRDRLYSDILKNIRIMKAGGKVMMNGSMKDGERLPNNLNISLPGVDTEFLALQLDAVGIACSTKSSCLKDEKESYVVAALGPPSSVNGLTSARQSGKERARSSLRFTLGRQTTERDINSCAQKFLEILGEK